MLEREGVEIAFRDTSTSPLSAAEVRSLLAKLGATSWDLVRRRGPAFEKSGLTDDASDDQVIASLAEHPGLLQRPIVVRGGRAVLGRPAEKVLDIIHR